MLPRFLASHIQRLVRGLVDRILSDFVGVWNQFNGYNILIEVAEGLVVDLVIPPNTYIQLYNYTIIQLFLG